MITITINNKETGTYIDGYLKFDEDIGWGDLQSFILKNGGKITIGNKYLLFGNVEITCADSGNRDKDVK
jgi:hypothetical protein